MEMLGRYEQTTALSNQNAGSCRWCFAVRGGREFFIKEYLEPKHPQNDTVSSPEKKERKLKKCKAFEAEKTRVFSSINEKSDGNAVRVEDFFRIGAKYYAAMPRIQGIDMEESDVAALPEEEKRRLCAIIAHALACVHAARYVHADVKHTNVIFTRSSGNVLTAKLIDYDAGYFEDTPPQNPEQIAGDQVYYAPEVCLAIMGGEINLSCKVDIFSLGVLFHQYYTGALPGFDPEQYGCVGEAVSQGEELAVSADFPADIRELICRMLAADPKNRPTAQEVYDVISKPWRPVEKPAPEPAPEPVPEPVQVSPSSDDSMTDFRGDAPGQHMWSDLGDL